MKGCFILQRRFLYIGHELAILLKEKGIVQEFCAYVQVRDGYDFLTKQTDIQYSDIILDEDIFKSALKEEIDRDYLKKLESEYGVLWQFLSVDRIVRFGQLVREYPNDTPPYSYKEMLKLVQGFARRIESFLDTEKPDFVYLLQPGSLGTLLLYEMAKKRGIRVFATQVPSMRDLVTLSDNYERITGAEHLCKKHQSTALEKIPKYREAKSFIDEFRSKPTAYSSVVLGREKSGRLRQLDFLLPRNLGNTIYFNFYQIFADWWKSGEKRTDYSTINPFLHLLDRVKRKIRNVIGLSDLYDTYNFSDPFAFYPLQYEPEMGIQLLAPFDVDQIHIIRRVAQSLPAGMYLYVKEHPSMVPYRPRRYYKEIKKVPNVKLIYPGISGFDLIKQTKLVTTISGTAGWEATMLGKPVITFGETFYNAISSVVRSDTPRQLPKLIEERLKSGGCPDEELIRFTAALLEDGAPLDLMYLWEHEYDRKKKRQGLMPLAKLLARKLEDT